MSAHLVQVPTSTTNSVSIQNHEQKRQVALHTGACAQLIHVNLPDQTSKANDPARTKPCPTNIAAHILNRCAAQTDALRWKLMQTQIAQSQ